MSLHKFFGIKQYTEAAIKAHADGEPFNPNGCSGNISMLYYEDTSKGDFVGIEMAFGTSIRAYHIPEYIYTINSLLDKGAEINHQSATNLRVIQCSYTLVVTDVEEENVEEENVEDENVEDSIATTTEPFIPASPELEYVDDSPEEVIEKLPNWDFAEAFSKGGSKSEAKKNLETYAREFGVELSRKQKFEDMMITFRVQMGS